MLRKAQFDIRLETSGQNGEDLVRQSSEGAVLVQDGDVIRWVYTCDLGADVGGGQAAGDGQQEGAST